MMFTTTSFLRHAADHDLHLGGGHSGAAEGGSREDRSTERGTFWKAEKELNSSAERGSPAKS